ncbi:Oxygen sensor protein DosP [Roseivivax sp. THAF40]|nr:GGDEF domain-containing phosphodiesterase [Roseivivax sp. THAF40]QFS81536.1 Oxygen sensor protein DosP [Roseivivax sp. THAF197b]QFT45265.1 Oxygen sensor protein DosP [Roseivivax sp. THAF40]
MKTVSKKTALQQLTKRPRQILSGPHALAFLPAFALAAHLLGGPLLMMLVATGFPLYLWRTGGLDFLNGPEPSAAPPHFLDAPGAPALADRFLADARDVHQSVACLLIDIGGLDRVRHLNGGAAMRAAQDMCLMRIKAHLRVGDAAYRIGDARFLVLVGPAARLDLEALLQLGARVQSSVEDPAALSEMTHYLTACIGMAHSRRCAADITGAGFLEAVEAALEEAALHGASAIRAWSPSLDRNVATRRMIRTSVVAALEKGQIEPWFQPQLCTSTGRVSGVEALARWVHPERGVIAPGQFLPALERAGRLSRLGEVMISRSLAALHHWDAAGLDIPSVSVNLAEADLRDPHLSERIKWDLDRHDLAPERLAIEVLETVLASSDECAVAKNVSTLASLGCRIDLDDFGTGRAPIATLRRMPIQRLKIDRSFVTGIGDDPEQRRILTAILSLADRLNLDTLAEGVETSGEHALLAQLGCDHVQGYGIAEPMSLDAFDTWLPMHDAKIADVPLLSRKA